MMMLKERVVLDIHPVAVDTLLELPVADGGIRAGFPSPAQDFSAQPETFELDESR
jgi:DNA polymerase V